MLRERFSPDPADPDVRGHDIDDKVRFCCPAPSTGRATDSISCQPIRLTSSRRTVCRAQKSAQALMETLKAPPYLAWPVPAPADAFIGSKIELRSRFAPFVRLVLFPANRADLVVSL